MSEDKIRIWATQLARMLDPICDESGAEIEDYCDGFFALVRWTADISIDEGDRWTAPSQHVENAKTTVEVWDGEGVRIPHIEERLAYYLN